MKAYTRQTSHSYWEQQITSWEKSNLSQANFCRDNKLNPSRFSYWKRKLITINKEGRDKESSFVQIKPTPAIIEESITSNPTSLCIHLPNKSKIEGITADNFHLLPSLMECLQ
jgi:hypothetical protein